MASVVGFLGMWAVEPMILVLSSSVLVLFGVLIFLLTPGPRRARDVRRVEQLLRERQWQVAQDRLGRWSASSPSPVWKKRLDALQAACWRQSADEALLDQRYEDSAQTQRQIGELTGEDVRPALERIVAEMLRELRALFAAGSSGAVQRLVERILHLRPLCGEAQFWLALMLIREGQRAQALSALEAARQDPDVPYVDVPLYQGMLLHQEGRYPEALRVLSEANRIHAACPFVPWQTGITMMAAGGDPRMAQQVLKRPLGSRGFRLWLTTPQRVWIEAFPEGLSFIRQLAELHRFQCPLIGNDPAAWLRSAEMALALAHERLGNYQPAADLYLRLLEDMPPTLTLLRGLGLSLARLGRYDHAYKYLRQAVEMEPDHTLTVGYLALSGARGRPQQPGDRQKNIAWAIRQVTRFSITEDAEFARVISALLADARATGLHVGEEDQLRLCDLLASVQAHDAEAAAAYDRLAHDYPQVVGLIHAWLYCWASVIHGYEGTCDQSLFLLALRDRKSARSFFERQYWDLEEVEYLLLRRTAARMAGAFPLELGDDYPEQAQQFLLQRGRLREQAGDLEGALDALTTLTHLAPRLAEAQDQAARLHFALGRGDQARRLLQAWSQHEPENVKPLVRLALLEHRLNQHAACLHALERALQLSQGEQKAALAFLGARLMLAVPEGPTLALLEMCLREQPRHPGALWLLAALHADQGRHEQLIELAPRLIQPEASDVRVHYLAAVALLASGHPDAGLDHAKRYAHSAKQPAEAAFLLGRLQEAQGDAARALESFAQVQAGQSPSSAHASVYLGHLHLQQDNLEAAIQAWSRLDPQQLRQWQLEEPYRQGLMLLGVRAFHEGHFQQAADHFLQAGQRGLRDRRLGPLIGLSLFRAGQQILRAIAVDQENAS